MTEVEAFYLANALALWRRIARKHRWRVRQLTVWLSRSGVPEDSVATRDGDGFAYVLRPGRSPRLFRLADIPAGGLPHVEHHGG